MIDKDTLAAVEFAESAGNPNAVSPKGARGPMQLMPATAADPGFGMQPLTGDQINDPEANLRFGAEYLNKMFDRYGNREDALAAYNWGPGNVDKWITAGRDPNALPEETRGYIQKVTTSAPQQPAGEVVRGSSDLSSLTGGDSSLGGEVVPLSAQISSTPLLDSVGLSDLTPEAASDTPLLDSIGFDETPTESVDTPLLASVGLSDISPDNDWSVLGEVGNALLGGVRDFAQSGIFDIGNAAGKWLNENIIDLRIDPDSTGFGGKVARAMSMTPDGKLESGDITLPEVAANETIAGNIGRSVVEFGIAFGSVASLASKAGLKAATTTAGKVGQAAGVGVAAGQWIYDPYDPRLSNLAAEYVSNPVLKSAFDALAASPEDSELVARLKMAVEDAGLGVFAEGVLRGIAKGVRMVANKPLAANMSAITQSPMSNATNFNAQLSPTNGFLDSVGTPDKGFWQPLIEDIRTHGWGHVLGKAQSRAAQKLLDEQRSFKSYDRERGRNVETFVPGQINDAITHSMALYKNSGVVVQQSLSVGVPERVADGLVHRRFRVAADGTHTRIDPSDPDWKDGTTVSLGYALEPVGQDVSQFLKYMVAKREDELAQRTLLRNQEADMYEQQANAIKAGNKGKHTRQSKALVAQVRDLRASVVRTNEDPKHVADRTEVIKAGDNTPEFVQAQKRLKAYTDSIVDYARKSDLLSDEASMAIKDLNEFYIPFYREGELADGYEKSWDNVLNSDGRLIAIRGNDDLSTLKDLDKNLIQNTAKLLHHSQLNHAKAKFWRDYKAAPQDVKDRFGISDVPANVKGDNIVSVRIDGTLHKFKVEDGLLLESLMSLQSQGLQVGSWLKVLTASKNLLTAGATASPTFVMRNLIRDAISSFVLAEGKQRNMLPLVAQAQSLRRMANPSMSLDVQEAYLNGAGFSSLRQVEGTGGDVMNKLDRFYRSKGIDPSKVIRKPWDWYMSKLDRVENASREAQYKTLRDQGATREQAAYAGRNVATDFSMRGSSKSMQFLNATIPFFNAAIQSNYTLVRKLTGAKDTQKTVARLSTIGLGLVGSSMALEHANSGVDIVINQPDWVKQTHWIMPVDEEGMPTWDNTAAVDVVLLPKPYDLGVFAQVGETLVRALNLTDGVSYDGSDGAQMLKSMGGHLYNVFMLSPSIPFVEAVSMLISDDPKSFTGQSIIPQRMQGIDPRMQFTDRTPEAYKQLGDLTGISPMRLEGVVQSLVGTIATEIVNATDPVVRAMTDRPQQMDKTLGEMPVFRALYRSGEGAPRQVERFYTLVKKSAMSNATMNDAVARGAVHDFNLILSADADYKKLIAVNPTLQSTVRELGKLNRELTMIQAAPDDQVSSADKRRAYEVTKRSINSAIISIHDELNKDPELRKRMNSSGISIMGN